MKKLFVFLSIILTAGLIACQKEDNPQVINDSTTFVFSSAKPNLDDVTSTKTEWTGETIQWSKDDQIRMAYTVAGTWQGASDESTTPKLYASNKLEEAATIASFTVNTSFTSTATGTHVFYGLFPGTLVSGTDFSNAPIASITVPSEQTPSANSFDSRADVMVGVSEEFAEKPTDAILMTWKRQVAHADLTLKNLTIDSDETIQSVILKAQDGADMVGVHNINLVTGEISNPQGTTNELILNAENLTYSGNSIKVWASFLPLTITELTVTVETDKAYYVRSFSGFSREFQKNKHNTMNIGMTTATRTEKEEGLGDYEETFSNNIGDFVINNQYLEEGLTYVWTHDNSYHYEKGSAYKSNKAYEAVSYLISPELEIGSNNSKLTFDHAANYLSNNPFGNYFSVVVLEGTSETVLTLDITPSGNNWSFVTSTVSLAAYKNHKIKIAFKYTSDNTVAGTWEVKNFKVTDVKVEAAAPVINVTSDNPMSATNENDIYAIEYSITNPVEGSQVSAASNVSWIHDFDYTTTGEVDFEVDAQAEGAAARTGVITLSYPGAENVEVTVNQAAAAGAVVTYQHIFTAKPSTGNSINLSGINWNIAATNLNNYNSQNYAGVQIGSSKKDGSITLTSSSDWSYQNKTKIKEVRLWLNLGGDSVTPSVTIGGKNAVSDGTEVVKNSSAGSDWTKATKVTFTPDPDGNTGVVVIEVTTVKAGYICAVEIDCE